MTTKRFITTFLLVAILAGSATLIASELALEMTRGSLARSENNQERESAQTLSAKNAYVEGLPRALSKNSNTVLANGYGEINGQAGFDFTTSDNLTDNYIRYFAAEVQRGNPEGPIAAADNGDPLVAIPDESRATEIIAEIVINKPLKFEVEPDEQQLKILKSPTEKEARQYTDALNEILGQTLASQEFGNLIQRPNSDVQLITAGELVANRALQKVLALQVPEPFTPFHGKLLNFLHTQANLLNSASRYGDDPLRAILAIEQAPGLTLQTGEALRKEFERLQTSLSPDLFRKEHASWKSFLQIPQAHAFGFGIMHDPIHTVGTYANLGVNTINSISNTGSFWQQLLEYVLKTLIDSFIDRLIDMFQNQVIAWIQGGGKPKFVTNWKGFFEDVADQAVGETIRTVAPQLCSNFSPMVTFYFRKPVATQARVACTLTQVANNLERFANNFMAGSWLRYGEVMNPRGNIFGSMIELNDLINEESAKKLDAEVKKVNASQGFKGVEVCTEYETTRTVYEDVVEWVDDPNSTCSGGTVLDPDSPNYGQPCEPGKVQRVTGTRPIEGGQRYCKHKETMTPGGAVAHSLYSSMNWKVQRIMTAERMQALVSGIIDAAISRTIKFGLVNITGLIRGGGNNRSNPNPSRVDSLGYKLETDYADLSEDRWVSDAVDTSSNELDSDLSDGEQRVNRAQDNIQNESANSALRNLESAAESGREWLDMVPLVFQSLNTVVASCVANPTAVNEAATETNRLNRARERITAQNQDIQSAISGIRALPGNPPEPSEVSKVLSDLGIGDTNILKSEAESDVQQLKSLKVWADEQVRTACVNNPASTGTGTGTGGAWPPVNTGTGTGGL